MFPLPWIPQRQDLALKENKLKELDIKAKYLQKVYDQLVEEKAAFTKKSKETELALRQKVMTMEVSHFSFDFELFTGEYFTELLVTAAYCSLLRITTHNYYSLLATTHNHS